MRDVSEYPEHRALGGAGFDPSAALSKVLVDAGALDGFSKAAARSGVVDRPVGVSALSKAVADSGLLDRLVGVSALSKAVADSGLLDRLVGVSALREAPGLPTLDELSVPIEDVRDVIAEAQEILVEAAADPPADDATPAKRARPELSNDALMFASLVLLLVSAVMLRHGAPKTLDWLNDVTTAPIALYALAYAIMRSGK